MSAGDQLQVACCDLPCGTLLQFGFADGTGAGGTGLGCMGIIVGRMANSQNSKTSKKIMLGWSYVVLGVRRVERLTPHVLTKRVRQGTIQIVFQP